MRRLRNPWNSILSPPKRRDLVARNLALCEKREECRLCRHQRISGNDDVGHGKHLSLIVSFLFCLAARAVLSGGKFLKVSRTCVLYGI